MSLSACIAFPVGLGDKEPFEHERLAFIEIGKSTKQDIATAMSNFAVQKDGGEVTVELTPQKYRGGDWWLYAQTREELKVWIGFYGGGSEGIAGDFDFRFLLIKFDEIGTVESYELLSAEGGCSSYGICARETGYHLLASENEDRVAKQFDAPAGHCGLYVYGKTVVVAEYEWLSVPIWLDDYRVGWFLDKKHYFFWQLDQGIHQLAALSPDDPDQSPTEFNCVAREVYFFEFKPKKINWLLNPRDYRIEIRQLDVPAGRKAIKNRRLTLNLAEPSA